MKRRILHERLASIVATMRHGELLYIADSGCGTHKNALYELDPAVEYIDLEAVTGSPSVEDIVRTLEEAGDFEAAIVPEDMEDDSPDYYNMLIELFGTEHVHKINSAPDMYEIRNHCKALVQTGDIGVNANVILVAGYPGGALDLDLVTGKKKYTTIPKSERK